MRTLCWRPLPTFDIFIAMLFREHFNWKKRIFALFIALAAIRCSATGDIRLTPASPGRETQLHALRMRTVGRAQQHGAKSAPDLQRQWPGTYFETQVAFGETYIKVGQGDVRLKLFVDGDPKQSLVRPGSGFYRLEGVGPGWHWVRLQVVSESQAEATSFLGFFGTAATISRATPPRKRQIEFIGDSHTVGYGNTSSTRDCTEAEVWTTTDTSQSMPALVAGLKADYQVNAISGRGVVRNYNGFPGDTLPQAYPFLLLNHETRYTDRNWHPDAIVVSLGTNDFSTPLHGGEKWKTRDELHADFEKTYVEFVQQLRAKHPRALIVLWATDMAEGEILTEVRRVVDRLRATGERKLVFIPMKGLAFSACNFHPSLMDDSKIAEAVNAAIHAGVKSWKSN